MTGIPIIKVEFSQMQHAVHVALNDHQLQMDAQFKSAIDQALQPERIQAVLNLAVCECLDRAVKEEVSSYFAFGDGRKAVAAKVLEKLKVILETQP